ncbi:hypothetical protein NIES37_50260 [Tolypothrix tenuis PCC 7101]|uniref:Uncharacterized protein n=1 Tax=Tolypothrix tenuis PCC 7101 TaxID=231146 RepID=A0A1Z4N5M9_9CYAN|nr:hypothetical protein [Tolypothrix sp. PCC 7601]MBD2237031.1 hypothetical protein [Aulosira sp. FACHB-113]BAY90638.1 hypothetical protein NIES3275_26550 [Microchaete diplosiphon NIES-3275]BAZ01028.1 hypothetical protein NIES37_50260 [Tolypothrix tenuis PCC 7101]BAZ75049.1 hypothetical protein NIES50_36290 [Aulosira laxa NIES-50]EKF01496.1 DNA-3-methyladenine glycosylase I [Tolypothrix sp. PCC 7601]
MEIQWGFNLLSKFIQFEIWLFLVGLMSSVFFLIIKKKINLRGLLFDKTKNQKYSPERLQLLLFTLIFVAYYLFDVRQNLNTCKVSSLPCSMPQIRAEFLYALGGSNFAYLWSKLTSLIKERRSERA